jgi:hypothetical protein
VAATVGSQGLVAEEGGGVPGEDAGAVDAAERSCHLDALVHGEKDKEIKKKSCHLGGIYGLVFRQDMVAHGRVRL